VIHVIQILNKSISSAPRMRSACEPSLPHVIYLFVVKACATWMEVLHIPRQLPIFFAIFLFSFFFPSKYYFGG